jgi:cholesterol oxidase
MSDTRERWSQPAENWLEEFNDALVCDVLVVGSGYGGSFAALALAQPNARVWVVERGQEHVPGTFAQGIGELPAHVRMSRGVDDPGAGNADALMDFRRYADVSVLLGSGLGGGSLINAGVAVAPDPTLLIHPAWPAHYRLHASHRKALEQTMAEVQQQLQAYPFLGAQQLRKFQALDTLGRAMGESARRLPLTIASTDQTSPAGIDQKACTRCGNCFTGCNVGAKNTLVTHVLPDAVRKGARLVTGATALEVQRLPDASGTTPLGRPLRWRVRMVVTQSTGHQSSRREFWVSAHTVVVAAGALGSTELLLRSSTLKLSPRLGQGFSTNGDVLALGWGMASPVHGMASEDEEGRPLDQRVGPTITGVVSPTLDVDGQRRRVFIEEGAVPSALTQAVLALGGHVVAAAPLHPQSATWVLSTGRFADGRSARHATGDGSPRPAVAGHGPRRCRRECDIGARGWSSADAGQLACRGQGPAITVLPGVASVAAGCPGCRRLRWWRLSAQPFVEALARRF